MYTTNPLGFPVSKARVPENLNDSPIFALAGIGSNDMDASCF